MLDHHGLARTSRTSYDETAAVTILPRFDMVAWRAADAPGPLLPGAAKILKAVRADGQIEALSWGQRFRYHGSADVYTQLWVLSKGWPTSSRMRLYGRGMQHREIRVPPSVCAGTAADLTVAMVHDPARADQWLIRYLVHGCLERQLRRAERDSGTYASVYLALWERVADAQYSELQHLLLWRVIARTIQRAPVYWHADVQIAMMPQIMAAVLDSDAMPPALAAALLLVACSASTTALKDRVLPPLTARFMEFTAARPAWRLTLEEALDGRPWPQAMPRLDEGERQRASDQVSKLYGIAQQEDELIAELEPMEVE